VSRGRRRLLFIAPVIPAESGNGLAMRAGLFLEALAADFEVSLLVIPVSRPAAAGDLQEFVASRTVRAVVLDLDGRADPHYRLLSRLKDPDQLLAAQLDYPRPWLDRFATSDSVREAAARFSDQRFEIVHVMRLYLASFARPYLEAGEGRPACVLDLDDDETETCRRLGALHALRRDARHEALELAESRKFSEFERRWLPRFDHVLVCSARDRAALDRRLGLGPVHIVPNAIRLPAFTACPSASRDRGRLHILFVGSLGYFPNADAARFLSEEVLPRLRARTHRDVHVHIVGASPPDDVSRLASLPGVRVEASVADLAPCYAAAEVVAVPVRAGGGTRIKMLEAFAHGVPVVSTPVGAEGLDVEAGAHLLIADDANEFATACLRLAEDPDLARAQAARARTLVVSRYAHSGVSAGIRTLYRSLGRSLGARSPGCGSA
jgi:glycosyltransferase involved in cell wall biosynthesis